MKLNLGCSGVFYEGYTSVDLDERLLEVFPEEDVIIADVRDLPFADNSVEEIYASHLLEHFDFRDPVLEEWKRVLIPGGLITVVVPDIVRTYNHWKNAEAIGQTLFWGPPEEHYVVDRGYVNAVAYGAGIINDKYKGPGQIHQQIFIGTMLIDAMKMYFPDAYEVDECPLRKRAANERMVCAHK